MAGLLWFIVLVLADDTFLEQEVHDVGRVDANDCRV